ncbi:MAG TPA: phosphoglucosamine mutase, partial [Myxococcaceae bacterium]
RKDLEGLPAVSEAIESVRTKLGTDGRVFVRYSGTEPKVRILIEGPDKARNEEHAQTIAAALTAALG